jgi:uncharacterized membrane protein YhaH (DUF805 family)
MNLINLLFTFQGRINRAKWWLAVLIAVIASVVMLFLFVIPVLGALLALAIIIGMFVSGLAVGIKRLHDRNKSGWWLVLFYGVPGVMGFIDTWLGFQGFGELAGPRLLTSLVSFVIGIWAIVELGCLRGSIGPNRYGPDPVAPR